MIYVLSDLHGCYDLYRAMLDKIAFSDADSLFVLGDVVDRGEHPVKLLRDLSLRPNVFPLMGNHDYIALHILKQLAVEITADNYATQLDSNLLEGLEMWLSDGGQTTLDEFSQLTAPEKEGILEYLEEFAPYETLTVNGQDYLLVHAGLPDTDHRQLDRCPVEEFACAATDYDRQYFKHTILVTGHAPTFMIDEKSRGRVYRRHKHLAIDVGAVYGCGLGCVCLDNGEEFYVR